ncbi:MAG TPA: CHAT domain-containing tetratricopeptide repeat protein, partial [Thermoanaerobaculia bacterium]
YRDLGDYQQAFLHFGKALEAFRALEDRRWEAVVLYNLGLLYQDLGEPSRALTEYEQALRLRREVGDAEGEAATLLALGQVNSRLGRLREAQAFNQRALALERSTGDRRGEGMALSQLGSATLALGDAASALANFDHAIELLHATGSLADEAAALANRGEAYTQLGDARQGLESLRQSLERTRAAGYPALEVRVEVGLARAERQLGRPDAARAHAEAALAIAESLRARIGSPDLRASFSALTHDAYELAVELLMEAHRSDPAAGHDRAALAVTERARARTLLELLAEAGVDVRQGADPLLLARRASLLRRLGAKAELALRERPGEGSRKAALEEERDAILRDLDVVETEIRERSPFYAALVQPRPLDAAGIQALLDPDTVLLSFSLGKERSFVWAVSAKSVESFELPGRAAVEAAARRFHEELSVYDPADRPRQTQDGEALGRMLLGPLGDRLRGKRLAVVPDGALEYVPFAALPGVQEVVYLPSASALAVQRQILDRRPPAPEPLLVLADPVFDARDPRLPARREAAAGAAPLFERLPGSRREAEAIAGLAPPGGSRVLLDFAANRAEVLSERLSSYRIIHFATHGVIDAEHPALSGLALSMVNADGGPAEGFVHLHDVYNLRLNADLVVLSGCRTALGKELRGEGLIGLARGFQYAGARRVLASLWRVEDNATAALMSRFYRGLWADGLRPAAALREAQLWVRAQRRWRDPYFWAGFVLAGDWR